MTISDLRSVARKAVGQLQSNSLKTLCPFSLSRPVALGLRVQGTGLLRAFRTRGFGAWAGKGAEGFRAQGFRVQGLTSSWVQGPAISIEQGPSRSFKLMRDPENYLTYNRNPEH